MMLAVDCAFADIAASAIDANSANNCRGELVALFCNLGRRSAESPLNTVVAR